MSLMISPGQTVTDRQRARATEFINRSDRDVTAMAVRSYRIRHAESDKKLNKGLKTAMLSLPAVAFASGLILKKGIKPTLKHTAGWGIILAAPVAVSAIGKALSKPDITGKKHNDMPFGLHFGLSLAGYFGGMTLLNKAAGNEKVNRIADTIIEGAKTTFNNVKKEVPDKITNKITELKSNIKAPKFVNDLISNAKKSETVVNIAKTTKNIAKKSIANSANILMFSAIGVALASAVKEGIEISSAKSRIKNAQLETARNLVDSYAEENRVLKG